MQSSQIRMFPWWGVVFLLLLSCSLLVLNGQSISSGTVSGSVTDPSGAVVRGATVKVRNALTGYEQTTTTDQDGKFRFNNIPPNPYVMTTTIAGFGTDRQQLDVRSSLRVTAPV